MRPVKGYCSIGDPAERRRLKLKHAWQLVYVFFNRLSTMHDSQTSRQTILTDGMHHWWLKLLQVRAMYKLRSRNSAHGLLSPCMCSSLVHACVAIVAALTDSRQSQTLLLFMVCVPRHITMCCLLRLAP